MSQKRLAVLCVCGLLGVEYFFCARVLKDIPEFLSAWWNDGQQERVQRQKVVE